MQPLVVSRLALYLRLYLCHELRLSPRGPSACTTTVCNLPVLLPAQVVASEGMAYNVVSNVTKDEDRMRRLEEAKANSSLTRVRPAVEQYMSAVGVAEEEKSRCRTTP